MDNSLVHADIFFFVTTIAVIVIGVLLIIVFVYLIMTLKRIKKVAELIHEEAVLFREDIHDLRDGVRREGFKVKNLFDIGYGIFKRRKTKKSKE